MTQSTLPARASYRIQAHGGFGFDRIAELADYLAELGLSHVYLSPVFTAVPGSQHGYDVIDHGSVNPELGGDTAYARMCEVLDRRGLARILDIVPNHMAVIGKNRLWWDVLENGPSSHFAAFFDVDWEGGHDSRILLPILGEHYFDALQGQLVRVVRSAADFTVQYYDHRLPAAPQSLGYVLRSAAPEHEELGFLADALSELRTPSAAEREATLRRRRDKDVLFKYLARLLREQPALGERIDDYLAGLNHDVDALDAWLERQNWRLAHWHNATTDLGYRRFFDVNTLAGLRVEDPRVFERVHRLVLRWLKDGQLAGVRVDHVDGLRDPQAYLQNLRAAAPNAWIVVEKILAVDEPLNPRWPIDGTTGYEFIRLCDQLFVDPRGESALTELDQHWNGVSETWEQRARIAKLQILTQVLVSERERLIDLAQKILTARMELRDCTRRNISSALTAILVSYPVYRSYVQVGEPAGGEQLSMIAQVIAAAAQLRPEIDPRVFVAFEEVLTLQRSGPQEIELAMRVQQVTGAITAKAIEDTLFYRHTRLIALNEVGGSPDQFGLPVDAFHRALETQPHSRGMLASATHDTKRGEDTRARLLALSELPELWGQTSQRWAERASRYRPPTLDSATEYFFYQTLLGTYPLSLERALAYVLKAARERKVETSWIQPNAEYEAALEQFVRAVYADRELQSDVAAFAQRIAPAGYLTSLARTLIKLTAPGIPDIYQGTELWDFSLVDPDNRSPVDFELRRELLASLPNATPESVLADMARGTPKLWLIWKVLGLRKLRPELFEGRYKRAHVEGPDAEHVVAFTRGSALVSVAPRLNAHTPPKQRSASVRLPVGRFRNILTDAVHEREIVPTSQLWARFPVALLVREA